MISARLPFTKTLKTANHGLWPTTNGIGLTGLHQARPMSLTNQPVLAYRHRPVRLRLCPLIIQPCRELVITVVVTELLAVQIHRLINQNLRHCIQPYLPELEDWPYYMACMSTDMIWQTRTRNSDDTVGIG